MAGQVKGITINFRGDTTSLDKALRKVKTDSKDIDSQLKKINSALKFNPKNVELLTQKQGLLREKVTQTQKSLEDLRKIQAQMDASGVSKQSAEYQQVRREIIETESKLKHFQGELSKLSNVKLTALRAQLDETSKKFKEAGDTLTKYVTAPIVALGGASAVAFNGVQDSLNIVTKLTGATGKDLEDMQNIIRDMGKRVPADFDTIATAVGEVNTRFGLTGDQLDDVSEKFVKFADLNGVDITQAIDSTQKAMSAFGLSAEDTGYVLDVLTKVGQNTGVSMDRLTQGLVTNSLAFQQMGLDINQSATLMGMLEKSGANMETVTNGLRKALKNASADGKDVNTALIELQDALSGGVSETEALNMAYELFGRNGDQVYQAVKSGALDFTALANASTDASGALEDTFDATVTPAKKFQTVVNQLKLLGYDIANSVLPVIVPLIEKVAKGIENISKRWNKLPKNVQKRIVEVAAALAAIGPALLIVSKGLSLLSSGIGAAQKMISGFSTALSFLAANPIVAIIAGITALVAAFVILWNKSEAFRNFFINLWNGIKTTVTTIWNGIVYIFTNSWSRIQAIWNGVGAFFSQKWQQIKNVFASVASWFGSVFGSAWNNIKSKFSAWGSFWSGLWTSVKNKFSSIGSAVGSAISGAVRRGVNAVIGKVESVINGAISLINGAIALADKIVPGKLGRVKKVYLPRLAEGGIVNSATVAMIGEGKSSEAVIPLDELWKRLDKMTAQLTGSTDGSPIVVNVYGAAGQNVNELAAAVAARLTAIEKQKARAWA